MLKRCKVVMLPTDKKATNGLQPFLVEDDLTLPSTGAFARRLQQLNFQAYHLYILSNDEIEQGDWCILLDSFGNPMSKPQSFNPEVGHVLNKDLRKVIATTDTSLNLSQPSQAFIEKYVDLYNKGQQIKEVNVEYELVGHSTTLGIENWEPKVSSDNTITIRKIKDSYTREEVVKLFDKLNNDLQTEYNVDCPYSVIEHWLKENL